MIHMLIYFGVGGEWEDDLSIYVIVTFDLIVPGFAISGSRLELSL